MLPITRSMVFPHTKNFTLDDIFSDVMEKSFSTLRTQKYPATDIYKKDNKLYIDVAVTGFEKDDINVSLENEILTIEAKKEEKSESEDKEYQYKSIARRSFKRKFIVPEDVEDINVSLKNGILTLELEESEKEDKRKVFEIKT